MLLGPQQEKILGARSLQVEMVHNTAEHSRGHMCKLRQSCCADVFVRLHLQGTIRLGPHWRPASRPEMSVLLKCCHSSTVMYDYKMKWTDFYNPIYKHLQCDLLLIFLVWCQVSAGFFSLILLSNPLRENIVRKHLFWGLIDSWREQRPTTHDGISQDFIYKELC